MTINYVKSWYKKTKCDADKYSMIKTARENSIAFDYWQNAKIIN
jgi:hypothetical protein